MTNIKRPLSHPQRYFIDSIGKDKESGKRFYLITININTLGFMLLSGVMNRYMNSSGLACSDIRNLLVKQSFKLVLFTRSITVTKEVL
jgi:hypothetical protein